MARKLKPNEFYSLLSNAGVGNNPQTAKKYWRIILDVITSELRIYGQVRLPYLLDIQLVEKEGYYGRAGEERAYIEPFLLAKYTTSEVFKKVYKGLKPSRKELFDEKAQVRIEIEKEEQEKEKELRIERAKQNLAELLERKQKELRQRNESKT